MRLFLALTLPDDARDVLAALQERLPSGRLTPEENLHLTLAFLGEHPGDVAEIVDDAMIGLRHPAIALRLHEPAVFGGRQGQAVGLAASGGAALTQLHARILSRLAGTGVTPDRRRFRPHVTLARLPGRADATPLIAALTGPALGPFSCSAFALFQSRLRPDGAEHEVLGLYSLG